MLQIMWGVASDPRRSYSRATMVSTSCARCEAPAKPCWSGTLRVTNSLGFACLE